MGVQDSSVAEKTQQEGQGRRTQRCAQPRARQGVQALADPELRMSLLSRRAHKATVGCRALKDENTV